MICVGRGSASDDHCCFLAGQVCPFLRENTAGRRFACALRIELGSWDAVHSDPRYVPIRSHLEAGGEQLCGDWQPGPGVCCREPRGD